MLRIVVASCAFLAGTASALTIDPIAQEAYLKASNTEGADMFGGAIAISGDTVVIGAIEEDSNATGVNGNQANNTFVRSGAAYVFVRHGTTWSQQAYLKASNTDLYDMFGASVSISGNTIVVGAPGESSSSVAVNGNQVDNSVGGAGAAYVFVRTGTTWTQQAYLKASNPGFADEFGAAVSVSGNSIVIGAWREDSAATGVNGNPTDNSANDSGAAYVFVRTGTTWSFQSYLKASNTSGSDQFGTSVSISGDTVAVSALAEDSSSAGVNGNQNDNSRPDAGAAYVFVRNGTAWSQQAYVKASNPGNADLFGRCVSLSGNTLVVGAPFEDSDASGVNGSQGEGSLDAGAAYAFVRNGAVWSQQAYLKASNTHKGLSNPWGGDSFGQSVAISGDKVVVGALNEDSSATGVNGNQASDAALDAGAAYVFARAGTAWSSQTYLKASNTAPFDQFGIAVAIFGDTVVVGSPYEDSSAMGVNGNQASNSADASGAAYLYQLGTTWTDLGFGLAGIAGVPTLAGTGTLVVGLPASVVLTNAAPNAPGLVLGSSSCAPTPGLGGTLISMPIMALSPIVTDAAGTFPIVWAGWPPWFGPGETLYFQYLIADAAAPQGVAFSNGLRAWTP